MKKVPFRLMTTFAIFSLLPLCGCQNNTQTGAALGAGAGSLAGAIIGNQVGHKGAGALIGGLTGGLTGAALGNTQDVKNERDAAMNHAAQAQANQRAAQRALTNSDILTMSQNGLSDEIIINSIRTRGGRFRTNSEALIALNQAGVSQQVVMEVQRYSVD
jgi:uncharacterized protein YcfJ